MNTWCIGRRAIKITLKAILCRQALADGHFYNTPSAKAPDENRDKGNYLICLNPLTQQTPLLPQ